LEFRMDSGFRNTVEETWKARREAWKGGAGSWNRIRPFFERARRLFEEAGAMRSVFGEHAGVLEPSDVWGTITKVAVVNAILAGLPGKMGVGVFVSMGLELWMAWRIARLVGLEVRSPRDLLRHFASFGGTLVMVMWGFRTLLGLAYSAFSIIPGVNPLIFAELVTTNLVGVLFWVGFMEMREGRPFQIPKRAVRRVLSEVKALVTHQASTVREILSPANLREKGRRLRDWMTGEMVPVAPRLPDAAFVSFAFAVLLEGESASLDGPLGRTFLQSIRDLYPDLAHADTEEIADRMSSYDEGQMQGVLSNVKGRFFERLVEEAENADGDEWIARLHDDRSHPSTDIVIENEESGEAFVISLKATDDPSYIEHALARYPDDPIWTTDEVEARLEHDDRVAGTGFSNDDLNDQTREMFGDLVDGTTPDRFDANTAVGVGTGVATPIALCPCVVAWQRGRISRHRLEEVAREKLGTSGIRLVGRLAAAVALGPVYLWFLLARTCISLFDAAQPDPPVKR